jgi:phospholipase C
MLLQRRVAGSPGWRVAGSPGRPVAGSPFSRRGGLARGPAGEIIRAVWERIEAREIRRRAPRPTGERPRPDLPPGTDLLPLIKHIVILMQENHSYDNYLGALAPRGDGSTEGLHHLASTVQQGGDPTQTWHASHIQYDEGFPQSVLQTVPGGDPTVPMGYWTEQELPFYYGLARTFPVADRWFCSCLGPTFPNRRFLLAGTAYGLIDDLLWDVVDYPPGGTILDAMSTAGVSWTNYHSVQPVRVLLSRLLGLPGLTATRRLAQIGRWLPPVVNAVRGNKTFTADLYPLGLARAVLHLRTVKQFLADADAGTLPAVSIVDPNFGRSSEENPQDISVGEAHAARIINAVMNGKGWPNTLLIWTYDEHGGYYDHVKPPAAVAPDNVPARNFQLADTPQWLRGLLRKPFADLENADAGPSTYNLLGFRVPTVIVSPYARRDYVTSTVYDHTSILKLIEQKWNLPALTERDAAATSPLDALDLEAPPAFAIPPELPKPLRN